MKCMPCPAWRGALAAVATAVFLVGAPGCPSPYTLGFPGTYPIARIFVDNIPGVQPIALYYPDTDPRLENLPVVILNTGWNQPRVAYDGFGTQMAQWGYIGVIKFVRSEGLWGIGDSQVEVNAAENSAILDWLAGQHADPASPLYGMVDVHNAATAGHSMGAGVAMEAVLSDTRFRAAINLDGNYAGPAFDPRDRLPGLDAAVLYFWATEGRWCSGQVPIVVSERFFDLTPAPTLEVSIIGADHLDFMDSIMGPTYVAPLVCPTGTQDAQIVRDIVSRYTVAWLNVHLKNQTDFELYYKGAPAEADIAAGLVEIRSKL